MQQVTGELKSAAEACTVTIITKPTKGDQLFRLGTVGMTYFADDVIQATIIFNDIRRIRICIFNTRNISWNIFFRSLRVSIDFFSFQAPQMSATSTKLVSLHCQFLKNILRKMINCCNWSNIFRRFCYSPYDALEFKCIAMHERPIISIARRTLADTICTLLGVFNFLSFPMTKELDEPNSTILKVFLLAADCPTFQGTIVWVWRFLRHVPPKKWKNARGKAKLGCGGATAPHAYFKPWAPMSEY